MIKKKGKRWNEEGKRKKTVRSKWSHIIKTRKATVRLFHISKISMYLMRMFNFHRLTGCGVSKWCNSLAHLLSIQKKVPTIRTPKLHQSAATVCPRRFTTSGAIYSTVPQKLNVLLSFSIDSFDNPKSVRLICPSASRRTLNNKLLRLPT